MIVARWVHPYVSPRERDLRLEEVRVRAVAYALKGHSVPRCSSEHAVRIAARAMAERSPVTSPILVPIPDSQGSTTANVRLAHQIAAYLLDAEVVDLLVRERNLQPSHMLRRQGICGAKPEDHCFSVRRGATVDPERVLFVDNVVTTGGTFEAARRALGGVGRGLAWARAKPIPGEKDWCAPEGCRYEEGSVNRKGDFAQRLGAAAERLYSQAMDIAEHYELRTDDDLHKLADALQSELHPRFIFYGSSRTVLPLGKRFVLKFGQEDEMLDEWNRWAYARGRPGLRKWLLPIVVASPGRWAVMPFSAPLSGRALRSFDKLHEQAELSRIFDGLEDDLGVQNWGVYRGKPVVLDYGGGRGRTLDLGQPNEDPFAGYAIRIATPEDPQGGNLGRGRWVLEHDEVVVHRFSSESAAWRFLQQIRHKGGRRPWGSSNKKPACRVVFVGEGSEFEDEGMYGMDMFGESRINTASYEEPLLACLAPDGGVVGILAAGLTPVDDERAEFRFSLAVRSDQRKKGIARALVRALKSYFESEQPELSEAHGAQIELTAWVVNPYMAALLESEGFEADWGGWSRDSPFMVWRP